MSFVDLASLTIYRRHEMTTRIGAFVEKCDHAIRNVNKLKMQAQGCIEIFNCGVTSESELKEKFLSSLKQLDEFTYLITDFNLGMSKFDSTTSIDYTPVQDTSSIPGQTQLGAYNLIDALSEPTPSTSKECSNCQEKSIPKKRKVPKNDQLLIEFSSTSCSSESVPTTKSEKEVQCQITDELKNLSLNNSHTIEECKLPAQTILQIDHIYPATVMSTDGISFWVITDDVNDVLDLMTTMTNYYKENIVEMSDEELKTLTYCAVYDDNTNCFYRGFLVNLKKDMSLAEVFLVDTGETRETSPSNMQPLYPRFCKKPPFARCCHLAGIDLLDPLNKDLIEKQETLLKDLMGDPCHIKIDDNSSESLDVYMIYSSGEVLNELLFQKEQISPVPDRSSSESAQGVPELNEESLNIAESPEYDDPVEAVTGYRYRDEIDICKHYRGGPNKTCFKGSRCTKRHVVKHPDGWTLDRVPVAATCRPRPPPAPGRWRRVRVSCVLHFDRFYVHLLEDNPVEETIPRFGVVLPPTTLDALILDMNSEATRAAYRRLQLIPAPGELVAALYSDENWYRAKVISSTRADQNVEVMYIDYGQVFWVKEDAIAELEPRFCVLEAQAVRCVLAGVKPRTQDMRQWAEAKMALSQLIHEQTLNMHVIQHDYDEVVVELFDDSDFSISEQLVAGGHVVLSPYSTVHEKGGNTKIVVP